LVLHEYVPYREHHGADTRLLDFLEAIASECTEVRFVSYSVMLGTGSTQSWEQPTSKHIEALELLGIRVDTTTAGDDLVDHLAKKIDEWDPSFVICTLWFWTWPLKPLWATLVVDGYGRATPHPTRRRLIILSDDVHCEREASRPILAKTSKTDMVASGKVKMVAGMDRWSLVLDDARAKASFLAASPARTRGITDLENAVYSQADGVIAITR
jgi:hypothetical protein